MKYIDELTAIPFLSREIYSCIFNGGVAPNDHCYWDAEFACWTENDRHFKERLKEEIND